MSYRYMRVVVLFDLPVETLEEKKEYRTFRRFLLKDGFVMMQQSVYTKLALNQTAAAAVKLRVKKNKPKFGIVQMISLTEKQFSSMEALVGEVDSGTIDSDRRVIVL